LIAYTCLRHLMVEAAQQAGHPVRRISFKGIVQALRQWAPHLTQTKTSHHEQPRSLQLLSDATADYIVLEQPGRSEPRAEKRRPKPYQLLTAPRDEMQETKHRGRYNAKHP